MSQPNRRQQAQTPTGFTLIECCLVITIAAIIAMLSHAGLQSLQRVHTRSAVHTCAQLITYAHQHAMRSRTEQTVRINLANNNYSLHKERYVLPKNVRFGYQAGLRGPPGKPTKSISSACTFNDACITVHPDGTCSSGSLYITDGTSTYAITVSVAPHMFIRRYRYEPTKRSWVLL